MDATTTTVNLKTLAQQFQQAVNQHDLDTAFALVDDALIDHAQPLATPPGKSGMRRFYEALINGFDDFRLNLEAISAEGDMLVLHGIYEGTHTGSFMGLPPSGNPIKSYAVEVFRVRDGKFVERFQWFDIMIIMQSLQTPGGREPLMGTRAGSMPSTTSPEQKRARIRQYFDEMVIPRNLDHMVDFLGEGVIDHSAPPGLAAGAESAKTFLRMNYASFPWTDYNIQHIIVDGDLVTTVFEIVGEHTGAPYFGKPATGKRFQVQCIEIERVPGEHFIEHWGGMDFLQLSAQLGLGLFGEDGAAADNTREAAERLAKQYIEGMNRGDIDLTMDVFADTFVDHQVVPGGASLGNTKADVRQAHEMLKVAFPDVRFTLEDLLVEGDSVVMRVSGEGTHQGPFFGMPPTGKTIRWTGVRLLRYENGKFAEGTSELDQVGILQQMGIIPTPPVIYDTEGNKATLQQLVAALNDGDVEAYDRAMAPDVLLHLDGNSAPVKGIKWAKLEDGMLHSAFHDLMRQVESLTASGDRVAMRLRYRGTHSGPYMGVPGTGQVYEWSGVTIDRFEDGKIVERWMNTDRFTLLQQVGLIPNFG